MSWDAPCDKNQSRLEALKKKSWGVLFLVGDVMPLDKKSLVGGGEIPKAVHFQLVTGQLTLCFKGKSLGFT